MASKCNICGSNPCYLICPTQDPFQGDHAAETADHEAGYLTADERSDWPKDDPEPEIIGGKR